MSTQKSTDESAESVRRMSPCRPYGDVTEWQCTGSVNDSPNFVRIEASPPNYLHIPKITVFIRKENAKNWGASCVGQGLYADNINDVVAE